MDQRQLLLLSQALRSYTTLTSEARTTLTAFITARWNDTGAWLQSDMDRFIAAVVPAALASQRQVALLTNAYLANMAAIATGTPARPAPLELATVTGSALRAGADPAEVYRRPVVTLNTALSSGASLEFAQKQGLDRAIKMASFDLQSARTHTMARQGTSKWYRRTLTGSENCALCVIASTQRYRRGTLMPIHPGCDCGVQEETTMAPSQIVDAEQLESIHAAIKAEFGKTDRAARYIDGKNSRSDYLDLIVVREHGEMGPVLTWRDQHFTGPADLAA